MINGNGLSSTGIIQDGFDLNTVLQKESVVDVEVPVKGLLLKESVVVCDTMPDKIEAHTSNISHFCTGSTDYPLFIKPNSTSNALTCRISDIVVYTGKLVMSDFQMMGQFWINRECERVQPKYPIFVSVIMGRHKMRANLFDLSLTGMCILTEKRHFNNQTKITDKKLTVLMQLPCSKTICKLNGKVIQVRPVSGNLIRIGMNVTMTDKDSRVVAHYL